MAGNKYLKNNNGTLAEEAAIQASAGAGDAGKIPALDAAGRLAANMMPVGIVPETASIVSSESLAAGNFVNIYNDAGTPKCRKADATTAGKHAHGFVLAAVTAPAVALVFLEGANTAVTGAAAGDVFLSTTAGLSTSTAPSAAGNAVQRLGVATSATSINFEPSQPIVLA